MSIELKLDEKAVASLFPEGSEARVRLQSAVVDQVVKRLFNKQVAGLELTIDHKVQNHYSDCVRELGMMRDRYSNLALTDSLKASIKSQAQSALAAAVREGLKATPEELEKVRKDVLEFADRQLSRALNEGLEARINTLVRKSLQNVINA